MNDDELAALAADELKHRRADAAYEALARITELWNENEQLIVRAREIHAEMQALMARIPPFEVPKIEDEKLGV